MSSSHKLVSSINWLFWTLFGLGCVLIGSCTLLLWSGAFPDGIVAQALSTLERLVPYRVRVVLFAIFTITVMLRFTHLNHKRELWSYQMEAMRNAMSKAASNLCEQREALELEFRCCICWSMPESPMLLKCGHLICGECWCEHVFCSNRSVDESSLSLTDRAIYRECPESSRGTIYEALCPLCRIPHLIEEPAGNRAGKSYGTRFDEFFVLRVDILQRILRDSEGAVSVPYNSSGACQ